MCTCSSSSTWSFTGDRQPPLMEEGLALAVFSKWSTKPWPWESHKSCSFLSTSEAEESPSLCLSSLSSRGVKALSLHLVRPLCTLAAISQLC